ncbi:MAG: hypothetical protein K1Y36_27920 [Blastocatellia bacterium]|nr:hypothetical protein [Blastocatellia bacterium]
MTAQITDKVHLMGNEYAICAVKGADLFRPEHVGMTPYGMSTACWRGFFCEYAVRENTFLLVNLGIGVAEPERPKVRQGKGKPLNGVVPKWSASEHCAMYEDLNLPVEFSGKLLVGTDFIRELYVHMGFHPAHTYREVYEVVIEAGTVTNVTDCSEKMAQIREAKMNRRDRPLSKDPVEIRRWVQERFSLEYEDYDD